MRHRIKVENASDNRFAFPTADALDAFEKRHQFKLPASYRKYALKYGLGILGGFYIIYTPNTLRSTNVMTVLNRQRWRLNPPLVENKEENLMVERVVYFSSSMGGDYFAWDPKDIRNPRRHEYGIYAFPRYSEAIPLVATSFDQFLDNLFNGKIPKILGFTGRKVKKEFLRWSIDVGAKK